jgi:hypothetical protein
MLFSLAGELMKQHPNVTDLPRGRQIRNTCALRACVDPKEGRGGAAGKVSHEKLRNDTVDVNFVAFATFSMVEILPHERGEGLDNRLIWDRGFLDHDENGDEIPIPRHARLTVRWLQGKVLLVAKGSLWNSDPATYDGRHNGMTAAQIRSTIERSLRQNSAKG